MYEEAAILEALDDEPATVPELAGRLGIHPATAERQCERLQRQGRVRLATGGVYTRVEPDPGSVPVASD